MRRFLLLFLVLALLLTGCTTVAPPPPTIAILLSDDARMPEVRALLEELTLLGHPPESLAVTLYSAHGDRTLLTQTAREALAARPTLVVAAGNSEALALLETGNDQVPVVLMGAASTLRSGLVDSFTRPGGLMTGLDNQHAELSGKRLELLTKLLPEIRRVLVIADSTAIPSQHALEVTQEAAQRLGIELTVLPITAVEEGLTALGAIAPGEYDAALLMPTDLLEAGAPQITKALEALRVPVMGPMDLEGDVSLLAVFGACMPMQGRMSARFVDKILRGERPSEIPMETPDNPELVVDLQVASRLGLELSPVGMVFARIRGETP